MSRPEAPSAFVACVDTPPGTYSAVLTPRGVARLAFPGARRERTPCARVQDGPEHVRTLARRLARELRAYHRRRQMRFTVPVDLAGHTAFRCRVWQAMQRIPYGTTVSYGELAARVGCGSARAVGQACGANPVPLLIPCHRVVAADGRCGGWSGRPGLKQKLLALEGVMVRP